MPFFTKLEEGWVTLCKIGIRSDILFRKIGIRNRYI